MNNERMSNLGVKLGQAVHTLPSVEELEEMAVWARDQELKEYENLIRHAIDLKRDTLSYAQQVFGALEKALRDTGEQ
jgi:hypothetical protein